MKYRKLILILSAFFLPELLWANPIPAMMPLMDLRMFILFWILCICSEGTTTAILKSLLKFNGDLKLIRSVVIANLISYPLAWTLVVGLAARILSSANLDLKISLGWTFFPHYKPSAIIATEAAVILFETWYIWRKHKSAASWQQLLILTSLNNIASLLAGAGLMSLCANARWATWLSMNYTWPL